MADRPIGAAIVGFLEIIFGVIGILAGLIFLVAGAAFGSLFSSIPGLGEVIAGFGAGLGIILIIFGALGVFIGTQILALKNWARIVATVFAVLGILGFPVGTIMGAVTIYFLWFHAETKAAFK